MDTMKKISNSHAPLKYYFGKYSRLGASIIVDIIGMATYGAPGAGEAADVIWAPISFIILKALYTDHNVFEWAFWEELIPFMDFIPSGCISWYKCYYKNHTHEL